MYASAVTEADLYLKQENESAVIQILRNHNMATIEKGVNQEYAYHSYYARNGRLDTFLA